MNTADCPPWLTPHEGHAMTTERAARFVALSTSMLEKLRVRGDGPPYYKIGQSVRYARHDLEEWLNQHRVRSTSE